MHENTWGRVKFLVNLIFTKLEKFDGPLVKGGGMGVYMGRGSYIHNINYVCGGIYGTRINGILR